MHPPSLCSFDLGIDFYGVDCDLGFADCTKGLSLVMVALEEVESTDTNSQLFHNQDQEENDGCKQVLSWASTTLTLSNIDD